MYTISKEFAFSSAHQLRNVPEGHPCGRLHGHNYVVTVEAQATELDQSQQWVMDFAHLNRLMEPIVAELDHRMIDWHSMAGLFDEVTAETESTSENLARLIFNLISAECPFVSAVTVSETPKTRARFTLCTPD